MWRGGVHSGLYFSLYYVDGALQSEMDLAAELLDQTESIHSTTPLIRSPGRVVGTKNFDVMYKN